ncbi:MAG: hypothetical protein IJJ69_07935 [Oscillospiraceae bacterium]|nr:hypothetical protein [Oscillospiraceae bacterium]
MLISEFENLTGIYPSANQYSVIEKFYSESKEDKHDFCRAYLMNADCLAERIQREANKLEQAIDHKFLSKISNLEAELEAEKKRADKLQQELDKELDWKPAEHTGTNMKQEDYNKLAESGSAIIPSDEEAIEHLSMLFGFMPEKIQILREVQTFEVNKYGRLRVKDTYQREPLYDATDWNYIRFDCAGNQWELVNGELLPYED